MTRHYVTRASVEGAIAQGLRRCGLRRSRYIGLNKTCRQYVLTAAALNLIRTDAWLTGTPLASTRASLSASCAPHRHRRIPQRCPQRDTIHPVGAPPRACPRPYGICWWLMSRAHGASA
ncbi:transposase [Streptomyces sp. CA-251387]|uniref:transposase n=1 Tax=Streptomyces sp. CA-251387 TaxID=3240064 RepID=UPI003D8DB7FD